MLKAPTEFIIIFILISVLLMLALAVFISIIIYRYQQKQNAYFKEIEALKASHHNALLQSQLEIQEQTFQNISREIHDNIGQKLTLAKLHLNTLNQAESKKTWPQINDSINMITEAIADLSDISRSMNSENILNNGLIKALEFEMSQLEKSGLYEISLTVTGETLFLETHQELVIFRIVQEALSNVIKHAKADKITINLHYDETFLTLTLFDNGTGFNQSGSSGSGLSNMKNRAELLSGQIEINSKAGSGTTITIKIPHYENYKKDSADFGG